MGLLSVRAGVWVIAAALATALAGCGKKEERKEDYAGGRQDQAKGADKSSEIGAGAGGAPTNSWDDDRDGDGVADDGDEWPDVDGEYYGGLRRLDPATSSEWQVVSGFTAAMIPPESLEPNGDRYVWAQPRKFGQVAGMPVCDGTPQVGTPQLPDDSCTAIAIAPRVMLTARHCIKKVGGKERGWHRAAFVYGFVGTVDPKGSFPTTTVHWATRVIAPKTKPHTKLPPDDDWALVEVEPPVPEALQFQGPIELVASETAAFTIGHPNFLPQQVSPGTLQPPRTPADIALFADFDVAVGNSGGSVFRFAPEACAGPGHPSRCYALLGLVRAGNGYKLATGAGCMKQTQCDPSRDPLCDRVRIVSPARFQAAVRTHRGW